MASNTPLDLGDVPIEFRKVAASGQPAPPLAMKTLDGKVTKISDFRGKFVLLEIGFSYPRGSCHLMQDVYEAFEKDDVFEMIRLHVGGSPKQIRRFIKSDRPKAIQCHMPNTMWPIMERLYSVQGRKHTMLIGPEGKIVSMGLGGITKMKPTVSRILAEHVAGLADK